LEQPNFHFISTTQAEHGFLVINGYTLRLFKVKKKKEDTNVSETFMFQGRRNLKLQTTLHHKLGALEHPIILQVPTESLNIMHSHHATSSDLATSFHTSPF